MTTVTVAAAADADRVAALINRAYVVERFFKKGDRIDADGVRDRMRDGQFLLLEDARGLAASVFVRCRGTLGYFGLLSVEPVRQGEGFGRRMVEAAEDACRTAGCTDLEIEVVNLRTELPPYYEKFGYRVAGERPFSTPEEATQPVHFVVMRKRLLSA